VRDLDGAGALPDLPAAERRALARQRLVGRVLAPVWVPLAAAVMRFGLGWRIEGAREARARYRRLRAESRAPLLVCANHLTLVDSFVVAAALGTPGFFLRDYASLPWNVPEARNFAATWWSRALVYLMKCVPVRRGGERREAALVLARLAHLMRRGEVALVFPEGGRSRSGRVDVDAAAYGVGRLLKALPGCLVLCVYLRGEGQGTWSDLPRRGERFRVELSVLEPKSDASGLRGSRDIARGILARLAEMESRRLDRQ
jgi:1-acyl-sn-glycerol-3-phosphate acyltransferase